MSGRGLREGLTPGSPRREAAVSVFAADLPPSSPLASRSVQSFAPHEIKTTRGKGERTTQSSAILLIIKFETVFSRINMHNSPFEFFKCKHLYMCISTGRNLPLIC